MRRYLVTSAKFPGTIEVWYSELLLKLDLSKATLNAEDIRRFKAALPAAHEAFLQGEWCGKETVIVEAEFEATFEMFWHDYPNKRNRHLAEAHWPLMQKTEQVLAYIAVSQYRKYCERNKWYNAQIGHTWLKKKEYLNDWSKL